MTAATGPAAPPPPAGSAAAVGGAPGGGPPTAGTGAPGAPGGASPPPSTPTTEPGGSGASPPADGDGGAATPDDKAGGGEQPTGPTEQGATESPGRGSQRQSYFREAPHLFGGDAVAGNKLVFQLADGAVSRPPTRLSPKLEDLVRHAFVAPEGWEEIRVAVVDRRTVVLRGRTGHGRQAMAVRLLQGAGATVIYELDPRVDLTRMADQLSAHPIDRGAAFLLHQPHDITSLDVFAFRSLEAALIEADARLVVTVGAEVSLGDHDLLRHQLDLPAAPDRAAILRRHLAHLIGDESRTGAVLDREDIAKLVAETLDRPGTTCDDVAQLAVELSRSAEVTVDDLRAALSRRSADKLGIWFDGLDDPELRSFAIALAALNGLPYEDVAHAARLLRRRLPAPGNLTVSTGELRLARTDPFEIGLERLLRHLDAIIVEKTVNRPFGAVPVTAVGYDDEDVPEQVIRRSWHGYRIQDQLIGWLGDLVLDGSERVRVNAGGTLGLLATYSFEYVRDRVLIPWSRDDNLVKREAVADALRVVARVPELHPGVMQLVGSWYANRDDPSSQFTAALAWGTGLGLPDADALAALERLAMVDNFLVALGIGRGLTALFADRAVDLALPLFDAVWRCMDNRHRTKSGQWAFLIVANDVFTPVEADGRNVGWPTLLWLAVNERRLQSPLMAIWARVLTEGHAVSGAASVLHNWARSAEAEPAMCDAFARMARAINNLDSRAGAALGRLAKQWNADDVLTPLPRLAAAVDAVLAG